MKVRMVLVRKDECVPPLTPLYSGPYMVLQRSARVFKLKVGNKEDTVSVHRLKPAVTAQDVLPADPPRRGRPPLPRLPAAAKPATTIPTPQLQLHKAFLHLQRKRKVRFDERTTIILPPLMLVLATGRPKRVRRPLQFFRP
jgi:hypothetical protein